MNSRFEKSYSVSYSDLKVAKCTFNYLLTFLFCCAMELSVICGWKFGMNPMIFLVSERQYDLQL